LQQYEGRRIALNSADIGTDWLRHRSIRPDCQIFVYTARQYNLRFCKTPKHIFYVLAFYTAHRHNLRFCKTTLQVVLSANDLQNRFTENSESATYGSGKNRNPQQTAVQKAS